MEKRDFIKIENVESENISNLSDYQLGMNIHSFYLETINSNINALQKCYQNYLKNQEKSIQNKINSYFSQINSILNLLSEEKDNILSQYESTLRKNEQKIRVLYSDIFNLKVKNTFLENNIDILLKKEKEYRLVKEKTGVVVENGTIVYNDRKDNEILILRKENSTLKDIIKNNEEELNTIKEKNKKEKENFEKQIKTLNHQLNIFKFKIKINHQNSKGKSISNMNINKNDNSTQNLKLNFTLNSNSINKGNTSNNGINNGLNNNNSINDLNNISNNTNKNTSRKKIEIKHEKKYRRNIISLDEQKLSLIHCQSTGHLNLKNKIINKLKKLKQTEFSKINETGLDLSSANKSATQNKKLLCLTPHNNDENNNIIANYHSFNKISDIKKKNKIKIINKNFNIMKSSSSNQNININNNFNEIQIIYKNKTKNKNANNKNFIINRQQKLKNELTWNQSHIINNSVMPNSPIKIKKINIRNKNMKSNQNLTNMNTTNNSKNNVCGVNNKRQRNIRNNVIEKNNSITNKFSLTSIRRKNTINTYINNCKTNLNNSPNSNKNQ